jgi:hypothetical protein
MSINASEQHNVAAAEAAFKIDYDDSSPDAEVRYLSATADTGWRYAITICELPPIGETMEGGPLQVTVLSPWVDTWALQRAGYLSEGYIREHLCGNVTRSAVDIRVLTLLVRKGLGREGDL